jgi:DNA-binding beta-propeller fold protein YncE
MSRRPIVASLAAGLVLSTVALPAAGQTAGFTDVPPGSVHAAAIERAVELELVKGTSRDTFRPDRSLTRAQVASVLVRALDRLGIDLPSVAGAPTFTDTGAPHEDAIRRLAGAGIVVGRGDGTFDPEAPVRRDQLASLVVRTVEYATGRELTPEDARPFDDVRGGAHATSVAVAAELGLLRGKGERRFDPFGATRRDQAASAAIRLFDRLQAERQPTADHKGEVWVLDQGTDTVHVYDGDDGFTELTTIDLRPDTLESAGFARPTGASTVPHMIEFDSQDRFAFIASTAGGVTIVVDARSKQVVDVLRTGAGSHMAAVTPDDRAVWVAAIGSREMVEIELDLDAGDFTIGRRLPVADLLAPLEAANGWTYPSASPVCHQYSVDGSEAWITLGPGWNQGALVVLDLTSGTLVPEAAYDPAEVKANCGVSTTADRVLVNWSGKVTADENTTGEWYVLDPTTYALEETRPANGLDTHGLRLTPDGTTYWQVNRLSDDALLIDADTLEVVRELEDVANTPDILDFSPDGAYVYITQRGPNPRSGAIHAASGDEPGLRIVDTATGETVDVLRQPELRSGEGRILNDVHGVGVRVATAEDTVPADGRAEPARASGDDGVRVRTVAVRTATFEAPRPEPTPLGFHCGLTPA